MHVCSLNPLIGPMLRSAAESYEIKLSKELYLSWIRDIKVVHPVAQCCWQLLRVIYKDHTLVQD